jgi:ABC-type sugar transport system ATPase subunit
VADDRPVVLECVELSKTYGNFRALDSVSLTLRAGEVRALLGKNGAGKSTLVKLISGTEHPDRGHDQITLDGQPVHWANSGEARSGGIAVVHQEFSLIPALSVAENVMVGRWPRRRGLVDHKAILKSAARAIDVLGEPLPLTMPVGRLSTAHQQLVEIAKALLDEPKVLILDEPTSALNSREVDALLALVRRLAQRGVAVIYVSHRMREIPLVADSMTILRDGREVATVGVREVTTDEVASMIAGSSRAQAKVGEPQDLSGAEVALAVENLVIDGLLEGVSFEVRKGEVLGIAGLLGSGRTELLSSIYGSRHDCEGEVLVGSRPVKDRSPAKMLRLGVAMTPEDRKDAGIVPLLGVGENVMLMARSRGRSPWIKQNQERDTIAEVIDRLSIATAGAGQPIASLSGGNQQKGVIGRCLAAEMSVLLLDEPTRGIDVGAKAQLYRLIRELAQRGISSVFVSSELDELAQVCDRVLVLRDGKVRESVSGAEATGDRLLALAMRTDHEELV